jgi:hypothetical protein
MKTKTRNQLIAIAVSVVVGLFMSLLESLAGEKLSFSMSVILPVMLGGFTYTFLSNVSATRKEAKPDAAARADALNFAVPDGRARVYILRTGILGKAVGMDITMDGLAVAQLKSPRFTVVDVAPGAHEWRARFSGSAGAQQNGECIAQINVAAGSAIVLRVSMKLELTKHRLLFSEVPLDSARAEIARATMVVAEKFA